MLQELINFIREQKTVSLLDISLRFNLDRSVIEGMILTLQEKGYIAPVEMDFNCKGKKCSQCNAGSCLKFYRWLKE